MTASTRESGVAGLSAARADLLERVRRARQAGRSTRPATGASFVPIRAKGSLAPFLCVPPVSGSAYWALCLSRLLPAERPVFAYEAAGVSGGQPLTTVAEIVDDYLHLARDNALTAPKAIVGYSMGGTVAFEMAARLA